MQVRGFVGPSYQPQSPVGDAERCVNLYPEIIESGMGPNKYMLLSRPGLSPAAFVTLPKGSVRALFYQDGRLFAVGGDHFYEVTIQGPAIGAFVDYGPIAASGSLASIASNGTGGHQLVVVSGGIGYVFDLNANTLTPVVSVNFPTCTMCAFLDGYFLILETNSNQFQISALEDGTSWSGLAVAQRSSSSDRLVALAVNHRELWLFGTIRTEVWWDTGSSSFPFAPISGGFIEQGAYPWSVAAGDNTLFWIGQTNRGAGRAFRAEGYVPRRVSTHAVEWQWSQYPRIDDVETFFEDYAGHEFWIVNFPTAQKTWAYDVATSLWHERDWYNAQLAVYEAHRPRTHAYAEGWAGGLHLVGDRVTGDIWIQSAGYYTDGPTGPGGAITQLRRRRRSPISTTENRWIFYSRFQLECQVGDGIAGQPNTQPRATLRWSNDRGRTFGNDYTVSLGLLGDYTHRAIWNRLGRGRSRVWEVELSDAVPVGIVDAYMDAEVGTS